VGSSSPGSDSRQPLVDRQLRYAADSKSIKLPIRTLFIENWRPVVSKTTELEPSDRPAEGAGSPEAQPPQRPRIEVKDSGAISSYANFCRVTGTPEELIIDFGLNPQPIGIPSEPVTITQRIVTNYFTAKRMLHALQLTVQRHEEAFGVLETDIQKRLVGRRQ
jgi:hypothetical protein